MTTLPTIKTSHDAYRFATYRENTYCPKDRISNKHFLPEKKGVDWAKYA